MSNLSSAQFRGVFHGVDEHGSKYTQPYAVDNKQDLVDAAQYLQDNDVRVTEHSHAGTCDEAGCKF